MAQSSSFVVAGLDRVGSAVQQLGRDLDRLQRQLGGRRRRLERRWRSSRRGVERRVGREVRRLRAELRRNGLMRQFRGWVPAPGNLERRVQGWLGPLPVVSRGQLSRMDRQVAQLRRRLRQIEAERDSARRSAGRLRRRLRELEQGSRRRRRA